MVVRFPRHHVGPLQRPDGPNSDRCNNCSISVSRLFGSAESRKARAFGSRGQGPNRVEMRAAEKNFVAGGRSRLEL
jgi:hypothetical protein